jgi:hypothetical protein
MLLVLVSSSKEDRKEFFFLLHYTGWYAVPLDDYLLFLSTSSTKISVVSQLYHPITTIEAPSKSTAVNIVDTALETYSHRQ